MPERASQRPAAKPARGVLRQPAGVEHGRVVPCAELASLIEHHWWARWSVPRPVHTETLPHPSVHLVFERQGRSALRAEVFGVTTGRFVRELRGSGFVFGVKLRPAAQAALIASNSHDLTDQVKPLSEVFGEGGRQLARDIVRAADMDARVALAESFLLEHTRPLPEEALRFRDLVERIARDRELVRVEDAAKRFGVDVRTLQRRFRQLVGVSPKWVINRYRMHEAAEVLKQPEPPALAELAMRLGYYDQAHFSREFKAVVGSAPRVFVAAARAERQRK